MKQMWDFYGPINFLRVGFKFAFYKVMNFLAIRLFGGKFPGAFSVEHFLLKQSWKIIHVNSVNSPEFLQMIEPMKLDLIVSVAASQKLKADLLAKPRYGCLNIHNAKLPKNRGMLPNFWSLFHSDAEPVSAITVHKMNATLDDGPIVLQEPLRLDPAETLHRLIIRTKKLNAHAILKAVQLFKKGEPPLLPNNASQATYNSFPTREDVQRFKAKGLKLL